MKTILSIPDEVIKRVDQMARARRITRSAIFSEAARAYVQRLRHKSVTERLNQVYATQESALDPVVARIQTLSLPKEPQA